MFFGHRNCFALNFSGGCCGAKCCNDHSEPDEYRLAIEIDPKFILFIQNKFDEFSISSQQCQALQLFLQRSQYMAQ